MLLVCKPHLLVVDFFVHSHLLLNTLDVVLQLQTFDINRLGILLRLLQIALRAGQLHCQLGLDITVD